jgi:hypothetical protein
VSFECDKYVTTKYPAGTNIALEDIFEQVSHVNFLRNSTSFEGENIQKHIYKIPIYI